MRIFTNAVKAGNFETSTDLKFQVGTLPYIVDGGFFPEYSICCD